MKRRDAQPITQLIHHYLREEGLETPLNQHRLITAWPEVVGKVVAKYTRDLTIHNQVLVVRLNSAALRAELQMRRTELMKQLNERVGSTVIYDIKFVWGNDSRDEVFSASTVEFFISTTEFFGGFTEKTPAELTVEAGQKKIISPREKDFSSKEKTQKSRKN